MKAHISSGGRYPVLRSLGILSIISAALVAIAGVAVAVWGLFRVTDTFTGRLIWFVGAIAAAFIACVWMLAFAETIKLVIDIEHNTRVGTAPPQTTGVTEGDGKTAVTAAHVNRMTALDEETAEAALLRGH